VAVCGSLNAKTTLLVFRRDCDCSNSSIVEHSQRFVESDYPSR
jgi:hypothetical protein